MSITWGRVRAMTFPLDMLGEIGLCWIASQITAMERSFLLRSYLACHCGSTDCIMMYADLELTFGH